MKEILAPAGGQQQLVAAVRCGADAVYLGTKGFNARQNAENFEGTSLVDTVKYCHSHGVNVYVTVNTLVTDDEFKTLEETAEDVASSGADAVIVQDLAVLKLFRNRYPSLPIHASTQCAVHNTDGAMFYEDLGAARVVLARELSLKEIETIRSKTSVQLEAFVHGALCMSLSGGCYLSSLIGGRSGNRGRCAQPCRLDFRCGGAGYALSLKDISHVRHLQAMEKAGVCSFKIEGRMKRPEYVAAAVTACRKAIMGEEYDEEQLRAVFSRSGFTDGYLTGKRGADMFGHRGKDDVTAAESVFGELRRLYDKERPLLPVDMSLTVKRDAPSVLTANCKTASARIEGDSGIVAEKRPTDRDFAEKFLGKCGGTPFYLRELTVENDGEFMLPPSVMNSMRRDALESLENSLGETKPHAKADFAVKWDKYSPPAKNEIWARFHSAEQIWNDMPFDRVILPLGEAAAHPDLAEKFGSALTVEPPAVIFPENEESVRGLLRCVRNMSVKSVYAENCGVLHMAKELGFTVYGGAALNVTNSAALEKYAEEGVSALTVSYEISMGKIARLGGTLPRGYISYGRLPVMRVRNCPVRAAGGCGQCRGDSALTDRTGAKFPVQCYDRAFSVILNSVPLHLGGKEQAKSDFRLLYFTTESREDCRRITAEMMSDKESTSPRTGGLYYRTLQ